MNIFRQIIFCRRLNDIPDVLRTFCNAYKWWVYISMKNVESNYLDFEVIIGTIARIVFYVKSWRVNTYKSCRMLKVVHCRVSIGIIPRTDLKRNWQNWNESGGIRIYQWWLKCAWINNNQTWSWCVRYWICSKNSQIFSPIELLTYNLVSSLPRQF